MFYDPTFWVLVAFVIFFAVLIFLKVPGTIGKQLDKRAEQIENEIREAEKLREEAQDLLATYQRKQREAEAEIEKITAAAKEETARMQKHGAERLEQSLARREKMATDRIAQAEAHAVDEVRRIAVDMAMNATREVVSSEVSGKRADKLVDDSISEVGKKLH